MLRALRKFEADESGAITVDWVVLTAAVVTLGGLMYVLLHEGVEHLDEETGQALVDFEVKEISFD